MFVLVHAMAERLGHACKLLDPAIEGLVSTTCSALEFSQCFGITWIWSSQNLLFSWILSGFKATVDNNKFALRNLGFQLVSKHVEIVLSTTKWTIQESALGMKHRQSNQIFESTATMLVSEKSSVLWLSCVLDFPGSEVDAVRSESKLFCVGALNGCIESNFVVFHCSDSFNPFPNVLAPAIFFGDAKMSSKELGILRIRPKKEVGSQKGFETGCWRELSNVATLSHRSGVAGLGRPLVWNRRRSRPFRDHENPQSPVSLLAEIPRPSQKPPISCINHPHILELLTSICQRRKSLSMMKTKVNQSIL